MFRYGHPQRHIATAKARKTVQRFIQALANPAPAQEKFAIKLATPGMDDEGHYWAHRLRFVGGRFHATVTDKTRPGGVRREVVTPDQIIDWMYVDNRKLVGNYTFRLVFTGFDPQTKAQVLEAQPFLAQEPEPAPTPATRFLHAVGNARLGRLKEMLAADASLAEALIPAVLPDPGGTILQRRVRPLAYAAGWNHAAVVNLLLEQGAEVDGRDVAGGTALHHAVRGGLFDMALLLVQKGARLEAKDHAGTTPLALAKKKFSPAKVKRLLAAGR